MISWVKTASGYRHGYQAAVSLCIIVELLQHLPHVVHVRPVRGWLVFLRYQMSRGTISKQEEI